MQSHIYLRFSLSTMWSGPNFHQKKKLIYLSNGMAYETTHLDFCAFDV